MGIYTVAPKMTRTVRARFPKMKKTILNSIIKDVKKELNTYKTASDTFAKKGQTVEQSVYSILKSACIDNKITTVKQFDALIEALVLDLTGKKTKSVYGMRGLGDKRYVVLENMVAPIKKHIDAKKLNADCKLSASELRLQYKPRKNPINKGSNTNARKSSKVAEIKLAASADPEIDAITKELESLKQSDAALFKALLTAYKTAKKTIIDNDKAEKALRNAPANKLTIMETLTTPATPAPAKRKAPARKKSPARKKAPARKVTAKKKTATRNGSK